MAADFNKTIGPTYFEVTNLDNQTARFMFYVKQN